ncbi:hypothetical protein L1887_63101 [Cichorium endivia]|nr:hypothetical protein L1887_63101 [Cichorium endivia]
MHPTEKDEITGGAVDVRTTRPHTHRPGLAWHSTIKAGEETSANLPSRAYDEAWRQDLELTCDPDVHPGSVVCARRNILHLPQRQEAIYDLAKHDSSTLAHKVLDDAVEDGVLVALGCVVGSELARTQLTEVLARPRDDVGIQLELDATCRVFADGDVHKHNGSTVGARARYTRRCRGHGDASVLGARRKKSQAWRLGPKSAGSSDFGFRTSPPMHPLIGGELWILWAEKSKRPGFQTRRGERMCTLQIRLRLRSSRIQPWTLGHWQRALASSQQRACRSATPWCLVSVSHTGGR